MTDANLQVVVGLGASGLSCIHYLKKRGMNVAVTDTRAQPPHLDALLKAYPDIQTSLGKLDPALLARASRIIISPGLSLKNPIIAEQIQRGTPVVGDIELFAEAVKVPVLAITGTNAKSTVTTLVGEMVKAAGYQVQVDGNLGIPALDLLQDDINVYVLELSSFQLETTFSLRPAVATILNVTPDHMDRYDDLHAYAQAKYRVYHNASAAVCNLDDPLTDCHEENVKQKFYFTGAIPKANEFGLMKQNGDTFLAFGDRALLNIKDLPVKGKHYQLNALASLAMGYAFNLSLDVMLKVLREFRGLPHRCQFVRELDGVQWYNDSKGTNVGATEAAIEGLGSTIDGKLVLIAGGVGKNADFHPLLPLIEKYCRHVVLIGEAAVELGIMLDNHIATSFAHSMDEAVHQAAKAAKPHDSVLLSPACASFDMFKNFEHRGDVFTRVVEELA